jgi:hypothetical protein
MPQIYNREVIQYILSKHAEMETCADCEKATGFDMVIHAYCGRNYVGTTLYLNFNGNIIKQIGLGYRKGGPDVVLNGETARLIEKFLSDAEEANGVCPRCRKKEVSRDSHQGEEEKKG